MLFALGSQAESPSIVWKVCLSILDIGFPLKIQFLHFVCTDGPHILHQLALRLRSGCGVNMYKHSAEIEFERETLY